MKCPFCGDVQDKVVDSRETNQGELIRRRRECQACKRRFTTYERIEEIQFMVVKKDNRREIFDRQKLLRGVHSSCQKRPVRMVDCQNIVNDVLDALYHKPDREIHSEEIGQIVMDRLKKLDKVAYVRFASVYREFEDVSDFMGEVKPLIDTEDED